MHGNSIIPSDKRFDAHQTARLCQSCMESMSQADLEAERTHEDSLCCDCRAVRAELDLDDGWDTYLAALKPHAVRAVEQIDANLTKWKCLGGSMTFGQDSKGCRYVATAKDFRFAHPSLPLEVVFGLDGVTLNRVCRHDAVPEWSVLFPFETPPPVILAALTAAVTSI